MLDTFSGASAALTRGEALVDDWLGRFERSRLRVPGAVDRRLLVSPARGIVAALTWALREPDCAPGTPILREVEKQVAFAGGSMGAALTSAFDVVAFLIALRDPLVEAAASADERVALGKLFDWLGALAVEGFSASREDALRLRYRDSLERGTPVLMITRELPAAILVGEPDRSVLDSVFGRLLLAVVRVDARAVIIDGGGLLAPVSEPVLEALGVFAAHRRVRGLLALLTGLPGAAVEESWSACFPSPDRVLCLERFDDAVVRARA